MKKNVYCVVSIAILFATLFLVSCASMSWQTPNYDAMCDDLPSDVTNYCDYKIEKCKLPDGKVVDMYFFNNVNDGVKWFNVQERRFNPEFPEIAKKNLERLQASGRRDDEWVVRDWKCVPTGPIAPFWKAVWALANKTGSKDVSKYISRSPISYFAVDDPAFGQLSEFFQNSPNFAGASAMGCYEDSDGVYLFTICPVKNLAAVQRNQLVQKEHKGQFGYEVAYIPRKMYADVKPVKLNPAKETPFNPNNIPDSNRNLVPVVSSGNGAYYYDNDLANELQWLAVTTACKGIYDMAYTGDFRQKNPTDYYQTKHIKKYLATNDGRASKGTTLFEGICFDYADFAYQELKQNKLNYPRVANFWMVGTFSDPNDVVAYRLANEGEQSNFTINRTPVVVNSHNHIYAHDGATSHAWFWVQATDGTMYWVDPTWTDGTGRPVYGIVRGGREVQLEPNPAYCVK